MVQPPPAPATALPLVATPSRTVTVVPGSAVPARLSDDDRLQLFSAGDVIAGAAGACVSTRIVRAAEAAETPPEVFVAVAVKVWAPSGTAAS
jgi:hypothetical protein